MLSGYRKPSLGGPNPERRQLSFRGQEVTTLRELETKLSEQADQAKRRKLLPTIFDPQKAPGSSIVSFVVAIHLSSVFIKYASCQH